MSGETRDDFRDLTPNERQTEREILEAFALKVKALQEEAREISKGIGRAHWVEIDGALGVTLGEIRHYLFRFRD